MEPNERDKKLLVDLDYIDGYWEKYDSEALPIVAAYRAEIEAQSAARIAELEEKL